MNYKQLRERSASLANQAGWDLVQPQADWAFIVNAALEEFSWETEYVTVNGTLTLVAGTAVYALPSNPPEWKRITDAVIGSTIPLSITDENTLRREDPLWIVAPADNPRAFWMPSVSQIQFYPTPSASGAIVTVRGFKADGPLVNDTDVPACPAHFHEGIALLAAWRHGKTFATGETLGKLGAFRKEADKYMADLTQYLAEQEGVAFVRRVARERAPRMPLGWMQLPR